MAQNLTLNNKPNCNTMSFNSIRVAIIVLVISLFSFAPASYAGFTIKKPLTNILPIPQQNNDKAQDDTTRHKLRSRSETFIEGSRAQRRHRHNTTNEDGTRNNGNGTGGWAGIVALVCACTVYYAPLAILFGAIGMQRGRKNRGMAKGAFIAGIVEVGLLVLAVVAFYCISFIL